MRTVKIASAVMLFALAVMSHAAESSAPDGPSSVSDDLAAALGGSSPVQDPAADPAGAGPPITLTLSVAGGPAKSVVLRCGDAGDGGSHPDPATACGLLRQVDGDLPRLTYDIDLICPPEYDPHTVGAFGTWAGRPVRFTRTYDNGCEMTALTGPLFRF
ncbi:SSI family serine proteinase inhibitor [Streptosporangium sp. NPDC048047]|uniref:SSI family serine proteinase inhibitor n=1 Tax=Streptosporangium sp. NPDC048047 TaxID=3155748 RepID=UPI0034147AA5